ncbi:MAG: chorismate-binding protein, partial [Chloroflexota bacterium]
MSTKLISVSVPAESINTYAFLRHGRGQSRFLWQDRSLTIAGIGTTTELFGWGERRYREVEAEAKALFSDMHHIEVGIDKKQSRLRPYLFGGFSFTSAFVPDVAWAAFYPAHFILPHYQLTQINAQSYLTINIIVPGDEEIDPIVAEIKDALAEMAEVLQNVSTEFESSFPTSKPGLKAMRFPMSAEQWDKMLTQAIDDMSTGDLDKVVLARICEIQLEEEISLSHIMPNLAKRYPNCNLFLFEPRPFNAFYGATPETLVDIQGKKLKTMGLAGSAKRGATAEEDEIVGNGLLQS